MANVLIVLSAAKTWTRADGTPYESGVGRGIRRDGRNARSGGFQRRHRYTERRGADHTFHAIAPARPTITSKSNV